MKTAKKATAKKAKKIAYVVDITDCKDEFDMILAFALAKQRYGLPISDTELYAIVEDELVAYDEYMKNQRVGDKPDSAPEVKPAKKPWYKRFWAWLTRK